MDRLGETTIGYATLENIPTIKPNFLKHKFGLQGQAPNTLTQLLFSESNYINTIITIHQFSPTPYNSLKYEDLG